LTIKYSGLQLKGKMKGAGHTRESINGSGNPQGQSQRIKVDRSTKINLLCLFTSDPLRLSLTVNPQLFNTNPKFLCL